MAIRRLGPMAVWVMFVVSTAAAAPMDFAVLFDSDDNPFTGCAVSGMAGVDHVLTTNLDTASPARVTGIFGQRCAGGALSAPELLDAGGWPALWNETTGELSLETRFPLSFFEPRPGLRMRVGIVASSGANSDVLLLQGDGGPILLPGTPPRRRAVSTPGRTIDPDGSAAEWSGMLPLATGGAGSPTIRILEVYGFVSGQQIFFRFVGQASSNAPTAADDQYSTTPGTPLAVAAPGILANDTDPRSLPLTAALVNDVNHGTLVLNADGSFSYTDGGGAQRDHFTYRASNGEQQSNIARVDIGISDHPNRAPVTGDDAYQVPLGGTLSVIPPGVLGNDNDPDLDPLQAILQTGPAAGTVALDPNGSFTYVHGGANSAPDSFTYHATDGVETSRETTVHINVEPAAPPVANDDSYTVSEGGVFTVPAPGLLANDTGSPLTVSLVTPPAHGALTLGTDGSFTYVHDGSETASDEFVYEISNGSATDTAVVRFTVIAADDAPVAVDDFYTVAEEGTLTVAAPGVLANDTDIDSAVTTAILASSTTNGALTLNANGSFTYTPNANFNGTDSFTYRAGDGSNTSVNVATVTILVTAVNDAPSFTAGPNVSVPEDSGPYSAAWATAISAGPANEAAQALTFTAVNNNNALFSVQPAIAPNGTLTFTPAGNLLGTATVDVQLQDNGGTAGGGFDTSATSSFTITLTCGTVTVTNPATTTATAGSAFSQSFTQSGGNGALTFTTASTLPAGLALSAAGVLSGTPTQTGTFPIVVSVTDGNTCSGTGSTYNLIVGCQTIPVTNPANSTGVANAAFSETFTQTGAIGGATFTTTSTLPTGLTLATTGTLSGTPTQTGTFPIAVTVTDGNGCTGTSATYNLTITCQTITVTNPAVTTGTANSPFSQTFTQTGAIGAVTFTTASPLPAGLTLAANGTLSGTPLQTGPFAVVVTATDSNGCTGTSATYNLVIGCQTITVGNPANVNATASAAFSEQFTQTNGVGTPTFTTASTLPAGLTLAADGTLSGTPTQTGPFGIVVSVTDANGCTGTGATYNLVVGCQTITVNNPANTTGTVSAPFSETFTQGGSIGGATYITVSPLPAGLTLATNGVLSGTPIQPGTFPIVVTVTDGNGCTGTSATYNLVIGCQTITVNNPANTTGAAGSAFTEAFTQSGAIGAVTYATASTLPTGLTLSPAGVLSGTPSQGGTFPIVVTVTDSNGCTGTGATYNLIITCPVITVTNPGNTAATAGTAFSENFSQVGGLGTITFTTASTLPAGLTLGTDGLLSGTPTQTGPFPIVVIATDQNGCTGTGSTYNLVVSCQTVTVNNPANGNGTASSPFSETFTHTAGIGTVNFTLATGTLPDGLTLATSGVLSGTPTETGSFPITVTATDSNGCSGTGGTYTINIACQTITVTDPATSNGTAGSAFSATFTQVGAIGTASFTTVSALPAGVTLSTAGVLSGTPTQTGSFPITVTVTDSNLCTGSSTTYTLVIACQAITVTNPANANGIVGSSFTATFTQAGAIGSATFTTVSTLPNGVTLAANGVLSGTPTQFGSFPVVVTVTDANLCTGTSATYNLVIDCQTITVTNPGVTTGTVGTAFSQTFSQAGALVSATFTTVSTLPTGLLLATDGTLAGTPTQAGTFPIVVTVTDANGCTGTSATYTLIVSCPTITVTNPANASGTAGASFTEQFTQTGAVGTATFSTASALPAGLVLQSDGVLTGTPSDAGTFPIVVLVTDSNGCTGTGAQYDLVIACQTLAVTNPVPTSIQAGQSADATFTFTATGILGAATWTHSGSLPAGITLNASSGQLEGSSTVQGSYPITVRVTDTNGCFDESAYTLDVTCPVIAVARTGGGTFPAGTIGTTYSGESLAGSGGTAPYSFAVTAGTFPAGLTLNTDGTISGTPTATGTFDFSVTATDAAACSGVQAFTIAINPAANDDVYSNLVNNTQALITGGATSSPSTPFVPLSGVIIANDLPAGGIALVPGTFATAQGGSVTIAADGTFLYTPPVTASALATDSFAYTISSDTGSTGTPTQASGTVTLNLAGRVWYVKNNVANGNGQSHSPFNSTTNFSNGARGGPDAANDIIFIHTGDGTTTNQNTGVALLSSEHLLGEGIALVVNGHTLVAAGTKPMIGNTTGSAVTLADNNTLKGFTATTTVGATLAGISGNALTTGPVIESVNIGPTTGAGLNITNSGTITTSLTTVVISGAGTVGINANTFGTLTIGSSVNVSGASALSLTTGAVSGMFNNVTATAGNVSLTSVTGTWGATAGSITGSAAAAAFNVSGGSGQISWGGSISQALAQKVINIAGGNSAIINFNGNVSSTGTSTGLTYTGSSGNYNLNQANTFSGSGGGITIGTSESGNITFSANTTITTAADAFTVDGSGGAVTAAITYSGTINKSSGGFLINVNNLDSPGTLTMTHAFPPAAGDLTQNSATASGISIVNSNSTNITIANASVTFGSTGPGFTSTGNAGGTLNLSGLTLAGSGSQAGYLLSGGGTINITSDVAAPSINMTGGTSNAINGTGFNGTLNLNNTTITGNGAVAVTINGGTFNGSGNSLTNAGSGLVLSTLTSGVTFGSITTTAGTNGISLSTVTGSLTINSGALSGATGATFFVSGGTVNVTHGPSISQSNNAAAVSISGGHAAPVNFNGNVTATNGTGLQFNNADGFYNFNATTSLNGGDAGIDVIGGSTGTFTFASTTTIGNTSSPSGIAFNIDNTGVQTTVTYNGTINTSTNRPVSIQNVGANSVISFTGNVTSTSNGILLATMGNPTSVTFSGASKSLSVGANTAVSYTGAAGNTVTFSNGGLAISRTTGAGIVATTGGTLIVTRNAGTANIINNGTSGTGLSLTNVAIGTGGLVFQSISQNGGSNGVFLQNTGVTAGLTIAGNSGAGTGGTIQNTTGADLATSGVGIYLDNTRNVSLSFMQLNGHQNYAIRGLSVVNFDFLSSVINGTNGNSAATDPNEASIRFTDLTGTANVTNCSISGGHVDNLTVINNSGTLDRITITGNTFGANSNEGNDAILLQADTTATIRATVNNNIFTSSRGDQFQFSVRTNGANDLVFQNNNLTNNHPNIVSGGGCFTVSSSQASPFLTFDISNNIIRDCVGSALVLGNDGTSSGSFSGTINANTIGDPGGAVNGSSQGSGIVIGMIGTNGAANTSLTTVSITNNQIHDFQNYGILTQTELGGRLTSTIQGNTISQPIGAGAFPTSGIRLVYGTNSLGGGWRGCLTIGHQTTASLKNNVSGTGLNGGNDIRVFPRFTSVVGVLGGYTTNFGGAPDQNVAMANWLLATNVTGAAGVNGNVGNTATYQSTCP